MHTEATKKSPGIEIYLYQGERFLYKGSTINQYKSCFINHPDYQNARKEFQPLTLHDTIP